jgi:cell wall-associated NlpC family hydrolase
LVNNKPVEENLIGEFRSALISYAKTLLGRPYRSGGKKPSSGFDCSGFTGYVFKQFGMALPNCSRSQSSVGVKISKDSAKAGDLVFFGRKKRKGHTQIYHAGIVASNDGGRLKVIHSATGEGVVVTDMSRPGYWRNHLVAVRRVIEKPAALALAQ